MLTRCSWKFLIMHTFLVIFAAHTMAAALESMYAELGHPSEPSSASLFRPSQVFMEERSEPSSTLPLLSFDAEKPPSAAYAPPRENVQGAPQCRCRWHWIALWIGWAGNVIMVVTVIVLAFQGRQFKDALEKCIVSKEPTDGNNPCWRNMCHVRQFLCKPPDSNTTEISSCKLCPLNWFLHEHKCYWISRERQTWHKSKEDCRAKLSKLLVIANQEKLASIQTITEGVTQLWVGLEATSPNKTWTWVDGSPLDNKLQVSVSTRLQPLGPAEAHSCGKLNVNNIVAEDCTVVNKWICETDALEI